MKKTHRIPAVLGLIFFSAATVAAEPHVAIGDQSFDSLSDALEAAKDSDVLKVSGIHQGNFTVGKSITLSGNEGAALDGQGKGTVLVIKADDVVVESLKVTGSGKDPNPKLIWGDAGVRVDGDDAVLRGLDVSGCDWGILLFGGQDSQVIESLVEGNHRDGVKVMGGKKHKLVGNRILQNQVGVMVFDRFGEATEMVMTSWSDYAQIQRVAAFMGTAVHSEDVLIERNEIRGNGMHGVHVFSKSKGIKVVENIVSLTGREVEPDLDFVAAHAAMLGAALRVPVDRIAAAVKGHLGSGILLHCGPKECVVEGNHCHRNAGHGIGLKVSEKNEILKNAITANRIGLHLEKASNNQIQNNSIVGNTDYGVAVELEEIVQFGVPRSSGNLLALNSIQGSKTNAFDGAGKTYSVEEMADALKENPPLGMPPHVLADAGQRLKFAEDVVKRLKQGSNDWDDGEKGNHYGDFDESSKGFEDKDGDGVGDEPCSIPGGDSVDEFPLKAFDPLTSGQKALED